MGRLTRLPTVRYSSALMPRPIVPVDVQEGDSVSVEFPADKGIITSKRGVIHSIVDQGRVRRYLTSDGAVIFAWNIGGDSTVKITLMARREYQGETLFSDEV